MSMNFDDKYAGETEYVGWDLSDRLEAGEGLSSAAFSVSDAAGKDVAPANILKGSPAVAGAIAKQLVADLVADARYVIVTTAQTTGGRTLIEVGVLRIRAAGE